MTKEINLKRKLFKFTVYLYAFVLAILVAINIPLSFTEEPVHVDIPVTMEGTYLELSNKDADNYLKPVVLLQLTVDNGSGPRLYGSATGFSVSGSKKDNESYLLTNDHFCSDALTIGISPFKTASIIYNQGDERSPILYNPSGVAYIVYTDPSQDLCLLKINEYIKPVIFDKKQVEPVTPVKIVGAPQGIFPVIFDTYISSTILRTELPFENLVGNGRDFLFISGRVVPGGSGSPIFNEEGRVVGIIFASPMAAYGGIGIQAKDITDWLDELDYNYKER